MCASGSFWRSLAEKFEGAASLYGGFCLHRNGYVESARVASAGGWLFVSTCLDACVGLGCYFLESFSRDESVAKPAQRKEGFGSGDICLVVEMQRWEDFAMTFIEPMYIHSWNLWTVQEPLMFSKIFIVCAQTFAPAS